MFRVGPRTVTRWAIDGRLGCIRTRGGHRRFLESEVTALLSDKTGPAPPHRVGAGVCRRRLRRGAIRRDRYMRVAGPSPVR